MSMYVDETLTCRDCGAEFVFTAGEQEFYAQRGFQNKPTRCKSCRSARKSTSGGQEGQREMYETVCAGCGGPARVPFVPRTDRPVYCSACFSANHQR